MTRNRWKIFAAQGHDEPLSRVVCKEELLAIVSYLVFRLLKSATEFQVPFPRILYTSAPRPLPSPHWQCCPRSPWPVRPSLGPPRTTSFLNSHSPESVGFGTRKIWNPSRNFPQKIKYTLSMMGKGARTQKRAYIFILFE